MTQAEKQTVVNASNSIIEKANTLKRVFQDQTASDAQYKAALMAFSSIMGEEIQTMKNVLKNI